MFLCLGPILLSYLHFTKKKNWNVTEIGLSLHPINKYSLKCQFFLDFFLTVCILLNRPDPWDTVILHWKKPRISPLSPQFFKEKKLTNRLFKKRPKLAKKRWEVMKNGENDVKKRRKVYLYCLLQPPSNVTLFFSMPNICSHMA